MRQWLFDLQRFAEGEGGQGGSQPGANGGQAGGQGGSQDGQGGAGKTFTQEEVNAIVAERIKREREKYADYDQLKADAEAWRKKKAEEMTEAEKAKAEAEKHRQELEALKAQLAERERRDLAAKVAKSVGLPEELATRLTGTTEEELTADAQALKKALGITSQTQPVGGGTNPAIQSADSGGKAGGTGKRYTREQIERMTPQEINANWADIQASLAEIR